MGYPKMRKLAALLILLLLSGVIHKLNAQSGFFKRSQIGISYSDIKSWRSPSNVITNNNQKSLNDVQSFGLKLNYDLNTKFFIAVKYDLDKVQHIDLNRNYFNSSYLLSLGYKYSINNINEIRPRIGFAVINRADYGTAITEIVGRPETRSVRHYYYGKEPFRNWSVGFDYQHWVSEKIYLAIGFEITYNFIFKDGRTYLSPTVGFQL